MPGDAYDDASLAKLQDILRFLSRMHDAAREASERGPISQHVFNCAAYARRHTKNEFETGAFTLISLLITNKQSFQYIMERLLDIQDGMETRSANKVPTKN